MLDGNATTETVETGRSTEVSIRGIDISFGGLRVLKGLDLEVRPSEFLVLLGSSGCGKSTLLNAIAGLQEVSEGQIWIGGKNVTWSEPKDRGIAMVFQSYALYPRMTVRDNMAFGLKIAGLPREEINRRVNNAAELLQITQLLRRRPAEISGGQRQRVAMGRAIVRDVGLFLFDEPLSNLDAQLRSELRVEIKRLHQRLGATMIYVTHDQIEALTLADRIAVMKDGVIQQLGTPDEVFFKPQSRYVASFMGSPKMNFFEAEIVDEGRTARIGDCSVPIAGYEAHKPLGPMRVELGIRPEHILLSSSGGQMDASVELVEPMGSESVVWTTVAGRPLSIMVQGQERPRIGDRLSLTLPAAQINLFDIDSGRRV
jgi:multiple sugar transport system ATP-binding protein